MMVMTTMTRTKKRNKLASSISLHGILIYSLSSLNEYISDESIYRRAIHDEMIQSMTTEDCLLNIAVFVCLRCLDLRTASLPLASEK
jgi:hypothetical protein